jgi:murein DD-endopeptidase MepM/ murein hydrolase activator NlpD
MAMRARHGVVRLGLVCLTALAVFGTANVSGQVAVMAEGTDAAVSNSTVDAAQAKLDQIKYDSQQVEADYQTSVKKQQAAQDAYDQATTQIAEEQAKLDALRGDAAQIALSNYQGASVPQTTRLLTSDDTHDLLSELSTVQSINTLTAEKMARYNAEKSLLESLREEAVASVDEVRKQTDQQAALLAKAQDQTAQAQKVLDGLTTEQQKQVIAAQATKVQVGTSVSNGASRDASRSDLAGIRTAIAKQKVWPASGELVSSFSSRVNPIGGYAEFHDGDDIAAACGEPVQAAWGGTVLAAGMVGGWGNRVVIDHGNGLATAYNPLLGFSVSPGQQVNVGDVIARVGSTGNSTGCHLHFHVIENGIAVDPAPIFGK